VVETVSTRDSGPDPPPHSHRPPPVATAVVGVGAVVWLAVALFARAGDLVRSFGDLGLLDLQIYRMGGDAVLAHRPLYDVAYAHDNLGFTYPPFAAVAFVPFSLLGWSGGAAAVTLASLAALARTAVLVRNEVAPAATTPRTTRALVLVAMAAFGLSLWPVASTLEFGQINLVLLWLVVEDVLGAGRDRPWGGALIGLATGIKLTPGFFILFLLVTGPRRRAVTAAATALATAAVGLVVAPGASGRFWTHELFDSSRIGNPIYAANQSWNAIAHRVLGDGTAATVVWLGASAVTVAAGLWLCRALWDRGAAGPAVVVAALSALVVSPISWTHHWVWLMIVPALLFDPALRPAPTGLVVERIGIVVLTAVVAGPRLLSLVPSGGDVESRYPWPTQALAASYPLLAVAVALHLADVVSSPRGEGEAAAVPADPATARP
jgi:alpha-1,2-mannosyltransferase